MLIKLNVASTDILSSISRKFMWLKLTTQFSLCFYNSISCSSFSIYCSYEWCCTMHFFHYLKKKLSGWKIRIILRGKTFQSEAKTFILQINWYQYLIKISKTLWSSKVITKVYISLLSIWLVESKYINKCAFSYYFNVNCIVFLEFLF